MCFRVNDVTMATETAARASRHPELDTACIPGDTLTSQIQTIETVEVIMATKYTLQLDPSKPTAPTRDHGAFPESIPQAKETKTHPSKAGDENASLYFIGTATTVLEWEGIRILTDPNFLHAGDHVHLGPGVKGTRRTNPAIDLHELPHVDVVLLSHCKLTSVHLPQNIVIADAQL